jgi:V8-like Glu-specific endopeptidase
MFKLTHITSAVAKLSLVFRKNGADVKMMGTGWLIRPDLLVTAGHCVYDKAYRMGQVKSIVAYLGYQGAESIQNSGGRHISNVEVAYGKVVGTTIGWIQDLGRQYDIAWVKLDKSFKEIGKNGEPIKWTNTPFQGNNSMLGIVGYPGDKELDGEHGAEMYECWEPTTFNLARSKMIQYTIDAYGGKNLIQKSKVYRH